MSWDKINRVAEECPKARKQFREWVAKNIAHNVGFCFECRDLFDFFDEQGIYISLHHIEGEFIYEIEDGNYFNDDAEYESTRTEAEEKAFEKAFELLENKLEGEK